MKSIAIILIVAIALVAFLPLTPAYAYCAKSGHRYVCKGETAHDTCSGRVDKDMPCRVKYKGKEKDFHCPMCPREHQEECIGKIKKEA